VADGYVVNPYGKDQNCFDWMAEGELWYSIEEITQAWSDGSPNHGVMVRAVGESGSNNWRQYLSGNYPETAPDGSHHPYFFVEYDAPAPTRTEWVQFEMDDVAGVFPTYNEAKANTVQPWDTTADWAVSNAEADAIEKLGIGVANEVTSSKLQPLGGDAETDPSELDPDEIPAGTPIDQTPPTITGTRPDGSGVPVNTAITVTFSEPVWGANIALKDSAGTAVQGTTALDAAKKVLTFTPAQALRHATTYSVEVNGATDVDGLEVAPRLWQFTTEVDVTPPTVTSTEPSADAGNVPLQTAVKVTFSEPVTDTVIGVKDGSGADVPGSVSTDGDKVWTFTPAAPLTWNGTYAVQVSGAKDASGNMMAPHSWSFATVTDTAAPTVAQVSPAGGATGVSVKTKVVVTFSEAVSDAQITAADAAGAPVLGDIAVDAANTTWTLTFGGPLNAETVHTVNVSEARDPAGNVMEPYSWSFTTAQPDTVAPTVTASSPEPDAVDVALGGPIKATLSEPVSEGQIVVKDPAGGIVAGTLAADSTTVLSFTPAQPLAERTKYTVEVTGAKDDAGNVMALHTWSFTTKELPPPPNSPTVAGEYVRPTNGAGAATTLTPEFRAEVTDPDGRPMTLMVEVEHDPAVPGQGAGVIWAGSTTTAVASGNYAGIFVPSGKLADGWKVRWRVRATAAGVNGAWTTWHTLSVATSTPALSTGKATTAGVTAATDTNTSGPFDYQRMSPADCNAERLKSPRPWHGFGWTVLRPYTGCYSRIAGWGDWDVDLYTGIPKTACPKSQGVRMTVNVIMYTNLGTTKDGPVVYGQNDPDLKARDISIWINISELIVVGANCVQTNVLDGRNITVRVEAEGSDNSDCDMIKGPEDGKRIATIGDFKRNGQTAFVFRSQGSKWGNCTLRPKLYPGVSIDFLDPAPFKLWHHLGTEQIPNRPKGDFPFVARCDSVRLSYPALRSNGDFYWPGHTGGCRILGADRVYTMYTEDPFRGEVARHIRDAFQNPQATDPKLDRQGRPITKNFPGNYDVIPRAPLTRRANSELAPDGVLLNGKNRTQMTWYCPNLSGAGPGKECDEYPFRSTFQAIGVEGKMVNNVWTPTLNASLRMVSAAHNGAAGRDLGAFYSRYRVFTSSSREGGAGNWPSNAFWVRIRTGTPPS
jgi:methionine-rich copper-binding protein CopC